MGEGGGAVQLLGAGAENLIFSSVNPPNIEKIFISLILNVRVGTVG